MAEIENRHTAAKSKKRFFKKKDTRIDLTPMVDLGFLLITFFVFTTTMATPHVMHVNIPYNKVPPGDDVCASCVLTAFLVKKNGIKYYEGLPGPGTIIKSTSFGDAGIRSIILQKRQSVKMVRGNADEFVLIIKPTEESTFQNFVDLLDEATINSIKRCYISEMDSTDQQYLLQYKN